jgi:hypothetical protein
MPRRQATNSIQMALDAFGVDWHSPRYGRPRLAGASSTIVVPDAGAFGALLGPMIASGEMRLDPRQPPAAMRADAWQPTPFWSNSARSNHKRVRRCVERVLGEGETSMVGDTLHTRWRDQAGLISLTSWPSGTRASMFDDLDPHHAEACLLEIVPGWRRPLSSDDMRILDAMTVVGRGTPRGVRTLMTTPPTDEDIGFVREPGHDPATMDAVVAHDASSGSMVACPGKLLIVPMERVEGLRLETYQEGAAAGHARLVADLEGGGSLVIAEHDETHGLDLVARSLAKSIDRVIERFEAVAF